MEYLNQNRQYWFEVSTWCTPMFYQARCHATDHIIPFLVVLFYESWSFCAYLWPAKWRQRQCLSAPRSLQWVNLWGQHYFVAIPVPPWLRKQKKLRGLGRLRNLRFRRPLPKVMNCGEETLVEMPTRWVGSTKDSGFVNHLLPVPGRASSSRCCRCSTHAPRSNPDKFTGLLSWTWVKFCLVLIRGGQTLICATPEKGA